MDRMIWIQCVIHSCNGFSMVRSPNYGHDFHMENLGVRSNLMSFWSILGVQWVLSDSILYSWWWDDTLRVKNWCQIKRMNKPFLSNFLKLWWVNISLRLVVTLGPRSFFYLCKNNIPFWDITIQCVSFFLLKQLVFLKEILDIR